MPFRALIDGKNVISLGIERDAWQAFAGRAKAGEDVVRMACCGATGILKISPRDRQFFAHKSQPKACDWKPESAKHLELKAVVHETILGVAGWTAEIEAAGPDWEADVLATRGRARIAFEVQLSAQGQAKTWLREERYETVDVLPWWIVTARTNAGSGFGSGLRSIVSGGDFTATVRATVKAVRDILRRVESQVRIAEAVARHLRDREIAYRLDKFCGLPIAFEIDVSSEGTSERQTIVAGELGADAVPDYEALRKRSPDSPWGTVAQFVRHAPQIKGFGSSAFFVKKDPTTEVPRILDRLLAGELVWRDHRHADKVEAALVWYQETCRSCAKPFARSPFAIAGHLHHWPSYPPKLVGFPVDDQKVWTQEVIRRFEAREGLQLGTRWHAPINNAATATVQNCPHCGYTHTQSLVSAEDALHRWPYCVVDWTFAVPVADAGWTKPTQPQARDSSSLYAWKEMLDDARRKRDQADEEERQRREQHEREMAEWREQMRRRREEEVAAAEAARIEAARKWNEEEERRQADAAARREVERRAREDEARSRLRSLAISKLGREDKAEFWIHAYQPKIGGRPFDVCARDFESCANLLPARRSR